jgi:hypothetical protein
MHRLWNIACTAGKRHQVLLGQQSDLHLSHFLLVLLSVLQAAAVTLATPQSAALASAMSHAQLAHELPATWSTPQPCSAAAAAFLQATAVTPPLSKSAALASALASAMSNAQLAHELPAIESTPQPCSAAAAAAVCAAGYGCDPSTSTICCIGFSNVTCPACPPGYGLPR